MKILGIVVLYHPSESLTSNINSYVDGIDKLIVWDNTPGKGNEHLAGNHSGKIIYLGENSNKGIGYALNKAVEYMQEHGYTHLLTMDQDSYFTENDFTKYINAIKSYGENRKAVFSTNYYIISQSKSYYLVSDDVVEVPSGMTSGSIYPATLFAALGNFREDLFVWGIDMEFSWRARKKGYPTLCFSNIMLMHHFGNQQRRRKLLGKEVFPNEYSPARSYYNIRNGIILNKEYPESINLKEHLRYHLYKRAAFVLLYESNKLAKLKAIYRGYRHGKKNIKGEYPYTKK